MATPSPSLPAIQLPTVWLAPPEALLPSNHKATIEPASIAVSAALASIVIILVFLIFKMKKGCCFDDRIKESSSVTKRLEISRPIRMEEMERFTAVPVQERVRETQREEDEYQHFDPRRAAQGYSENDGAFANRQSPRQAPSPRNILQPRPMQQRYNIRQPPPTHQRNPAFDDGTTLADGKEDDASMTDTEYSHDHRYYLGATRSNRRDEYAPSFLPKKFVMLSGEQVGLHGDHWR
ncbi:hypothetical protein EJ02DRAFT_419902 [Clathrospora elynae]|uniref:Uncharacterized protein n=1 Tax=Clathrospora elynae TaxID=706981 RepID=A0A6A5SYQ7_9PLEO|nr:hypothetical protein EJ02DRAFT_419902 [Clathrospora elynae]